MALGQLERRHRCRGPGRRSGSALLSYRKHFGSADNVRIEFNRERQDRVPPAGVVSEVVDPKREMTFWHGQLILHTA